MKIVEPWVEVENINGVEIMKKLEKACRACYRSENLIGEDSYKRLLANCINRGHESVLEHEKVTVRLYTEVGAYKDFTRHRIASFSIESTRYCSYNNDKFGGEISFMNPVYIEDKKIYKEWKEGMEAAEKHYMKMKELGATTDMCRNLLPHSAAAIVTMTANIREWRHILELRCNHTHPALRQIFIPLLKFFQEQMPELFNDIPYDEEFKPEWYAELRIADDK